MNRAILMPPRPTTTWVEKNFDEIIFTTFRILSTTKVETGESQHFDDIYLSCQKVDTDHKVNSVAALADKLHT